MKRKIQTTSLLLIILFFVGCFSPTNTTRPVKSSDKTITAFGVNAADNQGILSADVSGTIDEGAKTITLTVPFGTRLSSLAASFDTNGKTVQVGNREQISGTTMNDFSAPVTYRVTAENGDTQDYIITVNITPIVTENSVFTSPSKTLGVAAILSLPANHTITMIYAQDTDSITFPTEETDFRTATITRKFFMGETEVTNSVVAAVYQWAYDNKKTSNTNGLFKYAQRQLINILPPESSRLTFSNTSKKFSVQNGYDNYPVTHISWYGAIMFCNWLTEMRDGNTDNVVYRFNALNDPDFNWRDYMTVEDTTKTGYRLPSSNEWEYAARYRGTDAINTVKEVIQGIDFSTTTPKWTTGDSASGATQYVYDSPSTQAVAVYRGQNPVPTGAATVKSLGESSANSLNLYDMSGNVAEWCFTSLFTQQRITRGGSWDSLEFILPIGSSSFAFPALRMTDNLGFRLCRTAD